MSADNIHLNVEGISLSFGGILALNDISFKAREGQILAIIGPNGAGKTSLLNCLNNFYHADRGKILYNRRDLTKLPPYQIAKLGVARTFQHTALYTGLSTLDNLMAARHIHMRAGLLDSMIYYGRARREDIAHRQVVEEIRRMSDQEGMAILLVEQNARMALKIADYAYVMENGRVALDGPSAQLAENEDIKEFYLGLTQVGARKSYREVKHYKRRKRWLG